jgi:hypothetical protein
MPRVPLAEFEPALNKKLEELWGTPPNLYRALSNQPTLALAEAVTAGRVGERVYAEASKHFDPADYVELCLVVAFYAAVGRMIDALGVQLEPEMRNHSPRLSTK